MIYRLRSETRDLGTPLSETIWERLDKDPALTAERVTSDLLDYIHGKALAYTEWKDDPALLQSKAKFFDVFLQSP